MHTHHTFPLTIYTANPPAELAESKNNTIDGLRKKSTVTSTTVESKEIDYPAWTVKRTPLGLEKDGVQALLEDFARDGSIGILQICGQDYSAYLVYWVQNKTEGQECAVYDIKAFKAWLSNEGFGEEHLTDIKNYYHQEWKTPLQMSVRDALTHFESGNTCAEYSVSVLANIFPEEGILKVKTKEANFGLSIKNANTFLEMQRYLAGTMQTESMLTEQGLVMQKIEVSNPLLYEVMVSNDLLISDYTEHFAEAEEFELEALNKLKDIENVEAFLREFLRSHLVLINGDNELNNTKSYLNLVCNETGFEKGGLLGKTLTAITELVGSIDKEKLTFEQINQLAIKLLELQQLLIKEIVNEKLEGEVNSYLELYNRTVTFYQSLMRCQQVLRAMKKSGKDFVGDGITLVVKQFEENQFRFACAEIANSNSVVHRALEKKQDVKNSLINICTALNSNSEVSQTGLLEIRKGLSGTKFSGTSPNLPKLNQQLLKQKAKLENLIWGSADFVDSKFKLDVVTPLFQKLKNTHPNQANNRFAYYQGKRGKPLSIFFAKEVEAFEKIIEAQKQFDRAFAKWKRNTLDLKLLAEVKKCICKLEIMREQWLTKLDDSDFKEALKNSSKQFQQCFADFDVIAEKLYSNEKLMEQVKEQQEYLVAISPYQAGLRNEKTAVFSLNAHSFAVQNRSDPKARLWELRGDQKQKLIEKYPHSLAVHAFSSELKQLRGLSGFHLQTAPPRRTFMELIRRIRPALVEESIQFTECFNGVSTTTTEPVFEYWQRHMFGDALLEGLFEEKHVEAKEQNLLDALAIKNIASLQRIYSENAADSEEFVKTSLFYQNLGDMNLEGLRAQYNDDIKVRSLLALNPDLVFKLAQNNVNVAIVLFENKQALKNVNFSDVQKQALINLHKNNPEFFDSLPWYKRWFSSRPLDNTLQDKVEDITDKKSRYMEVALKAAPKREELSSSTSRTTSLLEAEANKSTVQQKPITILKLIKENDIQFIREELNKSDRWEEFFSEESIQKTILDPMNANHNTVKEVIAQHTQQEDFDYLSFATKYPLAVTFASKEQVQILIADVTNTPAKAFVKWLIFMSEAHHKMVMNISGVRAKLIFEENTINTDIVDVFFVINNAQVFFGSNTEEAEELLIKLFKEAQKLPKDELTDQLPIDELIDRTDIQEFLLDNTAVLNVLQYECKANGQLEVLSEKIEALAKKVNSSKADNQKTRTQDMSRVTESQPTCV